MREEDCNYYTNKGFNVEKVENLIIFFRWHKYFVRKKQFINGIS